MTYIVVCRYDIALLKRQDNMIPSAFPVFYRFYNTLYQSFVGVQRNRKVIVIRIKAENRHRKRNNNGKNNLGAGSIQWVRVLSR